MFADGYGHRVGDHRLSRRRARRWFDVLGGHIPAVITPLTEVLPHAREGSLRILAATAARAQRPRTRHPTFHELGFEDVVVQDWTGLLAPAGTPDDVSSNARSRRIAEAVMSDSVRGGMARATAWEGSPSVTAEFAEIVPESLASLWRDHRGPRHRDRAVIVGGGPVPLPLAFSCNRAVLFALEPTVSLHDVEPPASDQMSPPP